MQTRLFCCRRAFCCKARGRSDAQRNRWHALTTPPALPAPFPHATRPANPTAFSQPFAANPLGSRTQRRRIDGGEEIAESSPNRSRFAAVARFPTFRHPRRGCRRLAIAVSAGEGESCRTTRSRRSSFPRRPSHRRPRDLGLERRRVTLPLRGHRDYFREPPA